MMPANKIILQILTDNGRQILSKKRKISWYVVLKILHGIRRKIKSTW